MDVYYIYRRVMESEPLEAIVQVNVNKSMTHELGLIYSWAPNPHFDFRLNGFVIIPDKGVKDIASVQDCNFDVAGVQSCKGEDVALGATARFRARF